MGIENQIKTVTPPPGGAKTAPPNSGREPPAPTPSPNSVAISNPLSSRKAAKRELELEESRQQRVEVQSLRHDPDAIRRAFETGDYPYKSKVTESHYMERMLPLQAELLKAQNWVKESGEKLVILFEGRDAAGKGGTIKRFMEHLNPRGARIVALEKPNERERDAMVLPALHQPPALCRRNRVFRPFLV